MRPGPPCTLPVILLAAGASSRMRGRDKLMEEVDGQPLIARQARMARTATTGPLLVTLPPPPHPRHAALAGIDLVAVPVPDAASGLSASLRRGIEAVPAEAPAALVLLADLPEIDGEDLRKLCEAHARMPDGLIWRGATEDGRPGHPIIFSRALFGALRALSGDSGGSEIVARHKDGVTLVPLPGERARRDLDTPEDWAAWRAGHGH